MSWLFQIPAHCLQKAAQDAPRVGAPVIQLGDLEEAPDCWHWPRPALAMTAIWGVTQQVENQSVSITLSSKFPFHKEVGLGVGICFSPVSSGCVIDASLGSPIITAFPGQSCLRPGPAGTPVLGYGRCSSDICFFFLISQSFFSVL